MIEKITSLNQTIVNTSLLDKCHTAYYKIDLTPVTFDVIVFLLIILIVICLCFDLKLKGVVREKLKLLFKLSQTNNEDTK